MTTEAISKNIYKLCREQVKGSHVLCIQNSAEINFAGNIDRIGNDETRINSANDNSDTGFHCHPMLIVNAEDATPIGFSHAELQKSVLDKKGKKERRNGSLPIEEKGSHRWIESVKESLKNLPPNVEKTAISDREGDIYEALHEIPKEGAHILVCSDWNGNLMDEEITLFERMQSLPHQHTCQLSVKGNHSRKNRIATVELRYGTVCLKRPEDLDEEIYPGSISINCIYVVEDPSTVPGNEAPIEWHLLTTHTVDSVENVLQCIEWYKMRWYLEEIFRLLKNEAKQIESEEFESDESLKEVTLLALVEAWHIMSLKLAYDREDDKNQATVIFTENHLYLLNILLPTLEGNTEKQKNPYKHGTFAWAAWIIARLGGWAGYKSQAKAGYDTFKEGYESFTSKYELLLIMQGACRE